MRRIPAITLLAITMFLGFEAGSANAQSCPIVIPVPADAAACQCFATLDHSMRCGAGIAPATCLNMQTTAWTDGLLTADGLSWLKANGYCPVVADFGAGPSIYSICPQGCFEASTQILTGATGNSKSGFTSVSALASTLNPDSLTGQNGSLMTMSDNAKVGDVKLTSRQIERFTFGPEEPDLFVFKLDNGSTLRVTQHHPMVLHSGKIVEAAQVRERNSFISSDGRRVEITSITREKTNKDVFNFQTVGDTTLSHVIVAEGVLVGDLKLQNTLEDEQASISLRR
jgi:hypothetical protein